MGCEGLGVPVVRYVHVTLFRGDSYLFLSERKINRRGSTYWSYRQYLSLSIQLLCPGAHRSLFSSRLRLS